jgi:uncharacterized protein involved in exopolysaccharide biosynthesis
LIEGERVSKQLESQLNQLKAMGPIRLRDTLPTVTEDVMLSDLLNKLHQAQQTYVTLTNDYALTDLHVTRVQSTKDELNDEIDHLVAGIMAGLDSEVAAKRAAVDSLQASVAELVQKKESNSKPTRENQPYFEAKRNLEQLMDFQKLLTAKIASEKLESEFSTTSLVQITDLAMPGHYPVRPNKPLNIMLGTIAGLFLGGVCGSLAALMAQRLGRRSPKPAVGV